MGTRERPSDRGRRRAREHLDRVASDVRLARVGAGLSLRDVGAAADVDHVALWMFERRRRDLRLEDLSAVCQVLSLDLTLRAYPAGDPIRDAAHARLLARFKARLHPRLRWSTEVPLPIPGELRAWDAMVAGPGWRTAVEAETAINDVQALERKLALKTRDGGADHVLLLVADTRRNRRAIDTAPAAFTELPLRNRHVLRDLGAGRQPSGNGLVIL
jgi:transcriptional regulator with XRE-family HTH domain